MNLSNRRLYNEIQSLKLRIDSIEVTTATITIATTALDSYQGDTITIGTSTQGDVKRGHLVYYDSSKQWVPAGADALWGTGSAEMIGIALSNIPHVDGVLVKGLYNLNLNYVSGSSPTLRAGPGFFDIGSQVYISPEVSGTYTTTIPSGSGQYVRVLGHAIDENIIYFNPSKDFIEIT